jgi:serine/threonine protein kinase
MIFPWATVISVNVDGYSTPIMGNGNATVDGTIVSIDNIRLDDVIGTGANGFVFSGEDLLLSRRVAVKIWPPRRDRPQTNKARTDQAVAEARKIANFKSKDIASIYRVDRLPNSGWIFAVMEYIEGDLLADIRADLDDASAFPKRPWIWRGVYNALDVAERAGVYHGDLHEGNVIVTSVVGDITLIDFGTSVLTGTGYSLKRHARKVHTFAQRLLPELKDYVPPPDIPKLVRPEYATYVVGQWVEASLGLCELEPLLSSISEEDLTRRLASLAGRCSTTLVDLHGPVTIWLKSHRVPPKCLQAYISAANDRIAHQKKIPYPPTLGVPLRPVPPFEGS